MPPNSEQTIGRQCRKVNIFRLFSFLYGTFTLFRVHICFPIILQCVCHRLTNRVKRVTQVSQTTIKFVFIRKKTSNGDWWYTTYSRIGLWKKFAQMLIYFMLGLFLKVFYHIFSYMCIYMYMYLSNFTYIYLKKILKHLIHYWLPTNIPTWAIN